MAGEKKQQIFAIADFLTSAPWKHALFTTYALSLSYFESEVLRPLLHVGCDDIWLIADAEGYRASLLERRSMRVGQEYRLIPAAMPNGVLHAKSIYLCNDDEDLLLIGSGNVTFGGHGKNAEVFEALVPAGAASAFHDFADYLESLGSRPDIQLGRREWLDDFAARARRAGTRGHSDEPSVRLIHSLDSPVAAQLQERLADFGPCDRALIMSPYHDPDGKAVLALLQSTGAVEGAVSVWPGKTTPFPFELAAHWNRKISPVSMAESEKRFVHAKWYEFDFPDRRLLLTGSINATRKALTTTDNIELGVLRVLPVEPPLVVWKAAEQPAFEAQARFPSGLGLHEVVYADFDRSDAGRVRGQLISGQDVAGEWQVRLVEADGESFSGAAVLDEQGCFSIHDPAIEPLSSFAAVQVLLLRGDRAARGWVHNEMLLSVGARRRLTAGAMSRLMRRDGTDDDIQALLDYLSINAEQHLRLFDQPVRGDHSQSGDGDQDRIVSVHIDELAPISEAPEESTASHGGVSHQDDQFALAMSRLRRVLLGHGRARAQAADSRSDTIAEEDLKQERTRTPEDERKALGLDDFENSMTKFIDDAHDRAQVVCRLLVLLLEVSLWMRLARLGDVDGAHDFLSDWFFKACRLGYCDQGRVTALQQHVVTAAATLYALVPDPQARSMLGTSLHDSLEKFYRGAVDPHHARKQLFPDPRVGFSVLLFGEGVAIDLEGSLMEVLSRPTRRQQIDDALKLAAAGKPSPREWAIFSSDIGEELWKALQSENWQSKVRRGYPGLTACAFDYFRFPLFETQQYLLLRVTRCIHCKRFTVDTSP